MANRFDDVVSGLQQLLDVDVPVYSVQRDSTGRDRRAPFVRIERPIIENTFRGQEGVRYDVLFTVNIFTDERGNENIFELEQQVREATEAKRLDLDTDRKVMLRPREQGSTPLTRAAEDSSRQIKQRALEIRIRIEE